MQADGQTRPSNTLHAQDRIKKEYITFSRHAFRQYNFHLNIIDS
jgi:hypothetical protein